MSVGETLIHEQDQPDLTRPRMGRNKSEGGAVIEYEYAHILNPVV